MLYPTSQEVLLLEVPFAALAGVAAHLLYFIHGEHHMEAPRIMWGHLFVFGALVFAKGIFKGRGPGMQDGIFVIGAYLTALFTSIIIYRRFFHRLRKFPGPKIAGISKLWHMSRTFGCKNHLLLEKLHEQYGDFVRTGPTELTIFRPEVKWAVDGPGNNCRKAVWYDILLPLVALNTNRSKLEHDQRRRAWDQAITLRSMDGYEKRIRSHVDTLEQHIASEAGNPINVTEWIYFLAFDVMGDFAFAKSFNMLESKEWHYAVSTLRQALSLLGPLTPVPWLAQIAFGLPIFPVVSKWNRMLEWCSTQMAEQIQTGVWRLCAPVLEEVSADRSQTRNTNISSHLINYSRKRDSIQKDALWLKGDSVALIVAGSDTVASTLINLFYRIALHPEHASKIQAEIATLKDLSDSQGLKELVHLDACVNEVMRLHPSVPTGGYRETPPEGLVIADTYIPGNTTIVAPRYTIGRLDTLYDQPEEFVPERWYSRPEMVSDKKSFTPFSIGRYSCVGRKLALAEIRYTIALLLSKYDVAFAPGEDGTSVTKDMRDQFTAVPGKLDLVFTARTQKV